MSGWPSCSLRSFPSDCSILGELQGESVCIFLSKNEFLPLIISVMLSPTVTAVKKSHSYLLRSSLELECKLTSCDLKYKRSLLPQIKSWETLAKFMSTASSAGTSGGGGTAVRPAATFTRMACIALSQGQLLWSRRPPGPRTLHPDTPASADLPTSRELGMRLTPTQGTQNQDPTGPIVPASSHRPSLPCHVARGLGCPRATAGTDPTFSMFPWSPHPAGGF